MNKMRDSQEHTNIKDLELKLAVKNICWPTVKYTIHILGRRVACSFGNASDLNAATRNFYKDLSNVCMLHKTI